MKQHAKKLLKNPLIYGSSIVVFGSLFANFFNFLFNVFMTRNLSNADYGILASAVSLISLPSLMNGAIMPMVVQFAGNYFAKQQLDHVRVFYLQMKRFFIVFALLTFFIVCLSIPWLGSFLHIKDVSLLVLTAATIALGILHTINISFVQAKMAFGSIVGINIFGAAAKLLIGLPLIFFGFAVNGAVGAIFLSALLAYVYSFYPIKFVFSTKGSAPKVDTKALFHYGVTTILTLLGITSFITADIILVKHYFDPNSAGIYAALALIGKVIFYVASPIGSVMFSVVVQKYSKKENIVTTFVQALLLVFLPSLVLTILYFIFPDPTILFFTKKTENLIVSPLLGLMGIAMTSYVLLYIIVNFYLSINKSKIAYPVLFGAFVQIVSIILFHQNFFQIILSSLIVTAVLNSFLLLYFFWIIKRR